MKMYKICILDAKTLGDDMDISEFKRYGQVNVYPVTSTEDVIEKIKDQEIIITNKVLLNSDNLPYASQLKLICVAATGTNNIDLQYTKAHDIAVTNVVGYSTNSVSQHALAMVLSLASNLEHYNKYVRNGEYANSDIFTNISRPFYELKAKTWGIIGLGRIGKATAKLAEALGCKIVYYSTSGKNHDNSYKELSLEQLLKESDIVSIHSPLNSYTRNLIDYEQITMMKKTAFLINVGRGSIVNENGLAKAMSEGCISGAGLDVLENEPINKDNPLLKLDAPVNLIITPHIAWASVEARKRLINEILMNIEAFIDGEYRNRVT